MGGVPKYVNTNNESVAGFSLDESDVSSPSKMNNKQSYVTHVERATVAQTSTKVVSEDNSGVKISSTNLVQQVSTQQVSDVVGTNRFEGRYDYVFSRITKTRTSFGFNFDDPDLVE